MTFLPKLYRDYGVIEKPVLIITSYEELDDEEELQTINGNNNNYNVASDSKSDDKVEENLFDEDLT